MTIGQQPTTGVVLDAAGNLYGTASGGPNGVGVVFKISPEQRDKSVAFGVVWRSVK